ncbi:dihydrofolate reductase family protein [Sphingobacterium tabacisoli]|uniref:Dihydrofolate reductase family protein n=1 Tax=Sphingobacterium tabacisoli TaxID=2044855 RepID=A0ABW5L644_9SPHI|nr:dihydrofolate reductase family protein [Sphingobacterium tabacisoli]
MKVILVANISANGKALVSDNPHHSLPQEAMDFYVGMAERVGSMVIGAKTFENFQQFPEHVKALFATIDMVVLSAAPLASPEYTVVHTPEEAIAYFSTKGVAEIAVGGGIGTFNAFLDRDLVTDIYFNISPLITGDGGHLVSNHALNSKFSLAGCEVHNGFVQLHLVK